MWRAPPNVGGTFLARRSLGEGGNAATFSARPASSRIKIRIDYDYDYEHDYEEVGGTASRPSRVAHKKLALSLSNGSTNAGDHVP
jgi:hypothetical protein